MGKGEQSRAKESKGLQAKESKLLQAEQRTAKDCKQRKAKGVTESNAKRTCFHNMLVLCTRTRVFPFGRYNLLSRKDVRIRAANGGNS